MAIVDLGKGKGFKLTFGLGKNKRVYTKPESCRGCPLISKIRIPSDLEDCKHILVVGEAPGNEERVEMKAMTGPSGTLMREVMKEFGITDIGYANIIECEGARDLDDDNFWTAVEHCEERLLDEIRSLDIDLLIPAGAVPKDYFLPEERKGIVAIAGTTYRVGDVPYDILPIMQPASVLVEPKTYQSWIDQVNEIRLYFYETPGPFIVHPSSQKGIDELWKCDVLAIDFETTSFSPWDFGKTIGYKDKEYDLGDILCLSICGDGLNAYVFMKQRIVEYYDELKELLESKPICAHNGMFDISFFHIIGINPELKEDPMLLDYSIDESPFHGLKRLARRNLGIEDWSSANDKYLKSKSDSFAMIPPVQLNRYCGRDTAATWNLLFEIKKKAEEPDLRLYEKLLIPCADMFLRSRARGIRVDLPLLLELRKKWLKEQFDIDRQLRDEFKLNSANSSKQVAAVMMRLGLAESEKAETGKKGLEGIIARAEIEGNDKGAEFLKLVIQSREVKKALNTYLRDIARSTSELDGRLHVDIKLFSTVTGRLNASNPTLLNFPHATRTAAELRGVFIPPPGMVWFHRDQSQFELRVYAVITDDKGMKKLLKVTPENPKPDPHRQAGIVVYGAEEYDRRDMITHGYTRSAIKAIVFGRLYLRGVNSVAAQLGMPYDETEDICYKIDGMFPGIPGYRDSCLTQLHENQELINPLGRRRRFPIITNDNYHECKTQACNFPVQSTANDMNLMGMLGIDEEFIKGYDDPLVNMYFPVHDAVEGAVLESRHDELMKQIDEILAGTPRRVLGVEDLEFEVDGDIGDSWRTASLDW